MVKPKQPCKTCTNKACSRRAYYLSLGFDLNMCTCDKHSSNLSQQILDDILNNMGGMKRG